MNWEEILNLLIENKQVVTIALAVIAWWQRRQVKTFAAKLGLIDQEEATLADVQHHILELKKYAKQVGCNKASKACEELHELAFMLPKPKTPSTTVEGA